MKYPFTIKTRPTQIINSIFLNKKGFNSPFLKIIGLRNQLPITFGTALIRIKVLKDRNPTLHTRISNL